MALKLLGSKYCIDSLRSDVTDVQEAIIDVSSRAGPVRLPSWKYPDKISSDIDLTELLDMYDYSEEEEDRQIAHIVLLELLVDRMVLLFQSLTKFMDQALAITDMRRADTPLHGTHNTSTSIGLIIKKYWNKTVHLQSFLKNVNAENKANKRKVIDFENNMKKVLEEKEQLIEATETLQETLRTTKTPYLISNLDSMSRATSVISISKDECNKATQTFETAFVPCESCDCVQKCFRSTGNTVISMCQSQNLPSCLAKFKPQMDNVDWMSANDVTRWSSEQIKDMNRITKLLTELDELRNELQKEKTKNNKLVEKNAECKKEMQLERETQSTQRRHYETKIQSIQSENESVLTKVQSQNKELSVNKQRLEQQLIQMKDEMNKQKDMLCQIENAKESLESELRSNKVKSKELERLESDLNSLEEKLQEVSSKLASSKEELSKEKAKYKSTAKHSESVLAKQEALLKRIDNLDQNNEQLQMQVEELELEKENLETTIENTQREKQNLEDNLKAEKELVSEMKREKETLIRSLQEVEAEVKVMERTLDEAKERERLMVEYPDLNGPVNPQISGTGDIAEDMQNQVKANTARIKLLEEQNQQLRNSITRILKAQNQSKRLRERPENGSPVPLWRKDTSREVFNSDFSSEVSKPPKSSKNGIKSMERKAEDTRVRESFVIGRGRVTPTSKQRPVSGMRARPGSQKERTAQQIISCPKCDKSYSSKKDLEIHTSYCQR